ncbi:MULTISPECIES: DsbA family protein [unclassified Streptomyces]|uniref:DsbA family protein n=1 Tax=unclassified Streptomyces TaxID=2593676 RepID=UPI00068ECD31|nr:MULTISPECIES: thioredoxin domain-containing protein [unclassified Streptomyces]
MRSADSKPTDSRSADSEPTDSEPTDRPADSEPADGQAVNGQAADGRPLDERSVDERPVGGFPSASPSRDAQVRAMVHRRTRRRRTLLVSLVAAVVVVGAAVVGAGLVRASNSPPEKAPDDVPAGVTEDKAGLAVSTGPVRVDLYVDYLCPECRTLERRLTTDLGKLTENHEIGLVYHPVTFLDDYSSPGGYSTRAASAAACAAQEGRFAQYTALLFDKQPPERGPGLSRARLTALGREAGLTGAAADSFASCLRADTYGPWVAYVSDTAAAHKVSLTPTVMVDGERVDVTGSDPSGTLDRAIAEAAR